MVSLNISTTPGDPFRLTVTDVDQLFVSDLVELLEAVNSCRRFEVGVLRSIGDPAASRPATDV